MSKIGKNILKKSTMGKPIVTEEWWGNTMLTKDRVLTILKEYPEGLSINAVAKKLKVSWLTSKVALLELLSTNVVEFEKIGKATVFRLKG